eukprot:908381-Prorocentrum_minimum.AAC.3
MEPEKLKQRLKECKGTGKLNLSYSDLPEISAGLIQQIKVTHVRTASMMVSPCVKLIGRIRQPKYRTINRKTYHPPPILKPFVVISTSTRVHTEIANTTTSTDRYTGNLNLIGKYDAEREPCVRGIRIAITFQGLCRRMVGCQTVADKIERPITHSFMRPWRHTFKGS